MRLRLAIVLLVAFGFCTWLLQPGARAQAPGVLAPQAPRQTALGAVVKPIERDGFVLSPVAQFDLSARVLGRRDYDFGIEAALSPLDLALGWGRMSDSAVLAVLEINQSNRWYFFAYPGYPPIPHDEMVASSGNMHMIAADAGVQHQLESLRAGDVVALHGYLVNVDRRHDGFYWRTSLSRHDIGVGACEIVLVESVRVM